VLEINESSAFKRDRRRESRNPNHKDINNRIVEVLNMIYRQGVLPPKFKLHKLKGNYIGLMECHVKPDLLMIFSIEGNCVTLFRLGSHSELFK
jgi:mRNA interferase YafQ